MTRFSDLVTRAQLEKEFEAVGKSYRIIEAKNFWTDADRRRWSELSMRYTDLRKAIAQLGVGA